MTDNAKTPEWFRRWSDYGPRASRLQATVIELQEEATYADIRQRLLETEPEHFDFDKGFLHAMGVSL